MKSATVTGAVGTVKKAECLQGQTLVLVRTGEETMVAADLVGAGIGDRVILVLGAAAAKYAMEAPVDAAVVAVVDPKHGI